MSDTIVLGNDSTLDGPVVDADVGKWLQQRYVIRKLLGEGAMGEVYLAFDNTLGRNVAIKVNRATKHIDRLEREARSLAQVTSPNVTAVYDFGRLDAGRSCVIMQWIDGRNLHDVIADKGALPAEQVRRWMIQVCNGMSAAESACIVHRDLKPANILIDAHDSAIVTDFGLADSPNFAELTVAGAVVGTPFYIAPEQVADSRSVDARADIYSFGATFYHALTGSPPFAGDNILDLLLKHKIEPLEPPNRRNPRVPQLLNNCIERCMAKQPNDRFNSFAELSRALEAPDPASVWRFDDEGLAPYQRRYQQFREALLSEDASVRATPVVFPLPNGKRLSISFGDLAAEKADAIVSSDNCYLTMAFGVSVALYVVAGPAVAEEARKHGPARRGRVIVTSAGGLAARFLFHGVTVGRDGDDLALSSRDIVAEIVDACFYHAETYSIRSIAFPLLGTGFGGFPRDVALDTMFTTIIRRLRNSATPLHDVRIVLRLRNPE